MTLMDADWACHQEGGHIMEVTYDGEEEDVRDYYWDLYEDDMEAHENWQKDQGFWVGYTRRCFEVPEGGDRNDDNPLDLRKDPGHWFSINSPNAPMPEYVWRKNQPKNDDPDWEESCVARKQWRKNNLDGVDDYPCNMYQWAVCQRNNLYWLQRRCMNTKFTDAPPYGEDASQTCWEEESSAREANQERGLLP
jgi:hypothetical protein